MPSGDYPDGWKHIADRIRKRAKGRCECTGHCALHRGRRCIEEQGQEGKWMSGKIMLTVAHLNHYPPDCRSENLLAMCQRCHLRYDINLHIRHLGSEGKRQRETLPGV